MYSIQYVECNFARQKPYPSEHMSNEFPKSNMFKVINELFYLWRSWENAQNNLNDERNDSILTHHAAYNIFFHSLIRSLSRFS